ncbi:MAG: hypothetical protein ACE5LX_01965 [Nitrospinota bacterium]
MGRERLSKVAARSALIGTIMLFLGGTDSLAVDEHMAALGVSALVEPVKAPNFILRDLHGRTVNFEEFRGKVVQLNFWATW